LTLNLEAAVRVNRARETIEPERRVLVWQRKKIQEVSSASGRTDSG
jgi:hypothetical protein